VPDARTSTRVTHGVGDLLAQRVFAIACGHPDGNDADRLADDPIHKLVLERDPIDGGRLASQPTISRFEHTAAPRMLLQMSAAIADTVIARHRQRRRGVRLITIDLDATEDQRCVRPTRRYAPASRRLTVRPTPPLPRRRPSGRRHSGSPPRSETRSLVNKAG
jgi:hypothetical protein